MFWTIAAMRRRPVFDAGSLFYKQKAAEEAAAQAAAQYRATVLVAFQNVADCCRALQADARTVQRGGRGGNSANRSIDLVRVKSSRGRFQPGAAQMRSKPICRLTGTGHAQAARLRRHRGAVSGARRRLVESSTRLGDRSSMSFVSQARVFASASVLALSVGCALLLAVPRLVALGYRYGQLSRCRRRKKARTFVRVRHRSGASACRRAGRHDQFRIRKPRSARSLSNRGRQHDRAHAVLRRVTRLIAKIGDDVSAATRCSRSDSPEVVQAQTGLIAALHGLEKSKSQLCRSPSARSTARAACSPTGHLQCARWIRRANDFAAAESDLATAQGNLTAAATSWRVIVGRDRGEVDGWSASAASIR